MHPGWTENIELKEHKVEAKKQVEELVAKVQKLEKEAEIEKATTKMTIRCAELEAQNKAQARVMQNFERGTYKLGASTPSDTSSPY